MSRRVSLLLLLVGPAFVLFALSRAAAYDFKRYTVVSGFEASHWTWLLLAGAGALALAGLFVSRNLVRTAAIAGTIATVVVAIALFWSVRNTPGRRPEATRPSVDCSNQNIGIGCQAGKALDSLGSTKPPPDAPSRALLIAALAVSALISGTVLIRNRATS